METTKEGGKLQYPGGGEQGQSVGMDCNQGTKFKVVMRAKLSTACGYPNRTKAEAQERKRY